MIIRIFAFIFLFFGLCMPAHAKRIALVIGNADYSELSYLQKTHGDAGGYRDALSQLGFEVTHRTDLDFRSTATVVGTFIGHIQPGDEVAFVFAGHGWSDGRTNYLLPTDAPRGGNDTMLAQLSLPLKNGVSGILDQITARGATLSFSVIDACRDNPFIQPDGTRSAGLARGGLSAVSASAGSFVVYSAGEGQTALDRLSNTDSNPYSVFSRVFIPKLTSGIPLEQAANEAQLEVSQLAAQIGHNQAPAYYDQALGSTYLGTATASLARIAVTQNPAPVTQPIAPAGNAAQEAYNTARVIGTRQAFETVITRYPGTQWAEFAAAEIEKLSEKPISTSSSLDAAGQESHGTSHKWPDHGLSEAQLISLVEANDIARRISNRETVTYLERKKYFEKAYFLLCVHGDRIKDNGDKITYNICKHYESEALKSEPSPTPVPPPTPLVAALPADPCRDYAGVSPRGAKCVVENGEAVWLKKDPTPAELERQQRLDAQVQANRQATKAAREAAEQAQREAQMLLARQYEETVLRAPGALGSRPNQPERVATGSYAGHAVVPLTEIAYDDCKSGDAEACELLGSAYYTGIHYPAQPFKLDKDYKRAAAAFLISCDGGFAGGCFNLGDMYRTGVGVPKNDARAAALYRQACDGGDSTGCYNLKTMQ